MAELKKGIFVTATDTGVGKTFVSGLLIRSLERRGVRTAYFKPVASGCRKEQKEFVSEDIRFIETFTGQKMDPKLHCPACFMKPLAPLVASKLENRPLDLNAVRLSLEILKNSCSVLIAEGIGGVMVPLKDQYLVLDMMTEFGFPVLVVSRPALGTINHTLLTLDAIKRREIPLLGFVTNGHKDIGDEAAETSPEIIEKLSGIAYLGHVPHYNFREDDPDSFLDAKVLFLANLLT